MSVEYTIDIQLTELGFPDILQSVKEAGTSKQTSDIDAARCKPTTPRVRVADRADNQPPLPTTGHGDKKVPAGSDSTVLGQDDDEEEEEDDSDESEVSDVDEEEDFDEEGIDNDTSRSGDYRCSVCDLELPSKFKLRDHMNLHTAVRPYCCAECGKRFCQIYNYRVHLRTHAQSKMDRVVCRVCQMTFASQEGLKKHLSCTHLENEFYECDLCKRVFASWKECETHVQSHTSVPKFVCKQCCSPFPSLNSLARHRKRCHRIFKCTDCTKTFTRKGALLKHSFSHLGLLPYTCIRCNRHFRLAKLYRQHKCEPERIHCVACLREFFTQQDFQQHKKDTGCWGNREPNGDEIRCLECGQRFDTSDELKKHAGAHQRVLKCAECGKGFRSALLLMSHMGGHAGNSPCLCQSCGLGFPHQQNYDSHLKTCGRTALPARAAKKRRPSKNASPETKDGKGTPDSSKPADTDLLTRPEPAAPVKGSGGPEAVAGPASASPGPSDGLWKLTLNNQPPPGVNLVVFLPVCQSNQADGLTLPSEVSPSLPDSSTQALHQDLGIKSNPAASLGAPLNLITGSKQMQVNDKPLDLSKKCLKEVPPFPIKSESNKFDTGREEFQNREGQTFVEPIPGHIDTEMEKVEMDPADLSTLNVNTTTTGLKIDIKSEPQSPDCDFDSLSSFKLTEKEIKMEVDM